MASEAFPLALTLKTLLHVHTFATKLLVGIYDKRLHKFLLPDQLEGSLDGYGQYCRMVRRSAQGDELCRQDMVNRGRDSSVAGLQVCHGGLWTYQMPVTVNGEDVAVIISGKFRLGNADRVEESMLRRQALYEKLGLATADSAACNEAFDAVRQLSHAQLVGQVVPSLEELQGEVRGVYQVVHERQTLEADKAALNEHILNVSHDLQLRLQAIMASAEMFLVDLEKRQSLIPAEVVAEAGGLRREIEKFRVPLLNLGHETMHGQYEFEVCSLGQIIQHSMNLYESEASRKNVRFEVRPEIQEFPMIEMSRGHIDHVVNNLVDNAVKYSYYGTESKTRVVRIVGKLARPYYRLTVDNYGIGIRHHELEEVFKRGYRSELAKHERRRGSGLGLAIAKEIVEAHHGWITAASRELEGAWIVRFTVSLPLRQP